MLTKSQLESIADIPRRKPFIDANLLQTQALMKRLADVSSAVNQAKTSATAGSDQDRARLDELLMGLAAVLEAIGAIKIPEVNLPKEYNVKLSEADLKELKPATINIPEIPSEMKVRLNSSDIAQLKTVVPEVKIPDSFSISNLTEVLTLLREVSSKLDRVQASTAALESIRVSNFQELSIPQPVFPTELLQQILDKLTNGVNNPMAVRLVDKEGFYSARNDIGIPVSTGGGGRKDPLAEYRPADSNESDATYSYWAFTKHDGSWYILREDKTNHTYRYAKGGSYSTTIWTNRATQSYDYLHSYTW